MNHYVALAICAIILIGWSFYFVYRTIEAYNEGNMKNFVWYVCMTTFHTLLFIAIEYALGGII